MNELDLSRAQWHKSSRSSANGQCVEVAHLDQAVAVRDSKNPAGPKLIFTRQAWTSFICGLKDGDGTRGEAAGLCCLPAKLVRASTDRMLSQAQER